MMITEDIHIHTSVSNCAKRDATIEKYIERAAGGQLTTLGFSDHLWDSAVSGVSKWYSNQNVEHVMQTKDAIMNCAQNHGIKLLFGCETEFTYEGKLCLAEESFDLFDYVLVPHSHTHMACVMPREYAEDNKLHAKFLMDSFMAAVEHPLSNRFTAIVHPFVPGTKYDVYNEIQSLIPNSYFYEAFNAAREKGIAIEMNGSTLIYMPDEQIPDCEYVRIYSIAKECGCKFTYGSDSHDFRGERKLQVVERFLDLCKITDADILTSDSFVK